MSSRTLIVILLSAGITFILRALPFLIFRGKRKMPEFLIRLNEVLPAGIMAVLIVYCLKDVTDAFCFQGLAKIISTVTVVVTYKWKHNTLFSIVAGTALYMVLLQVL